MNELAGYEDVVGEVRAELVARVDAAVLAGVDPGRLVLDPGLGFAKTAAHNWALLRRLDVLIGLGLPGAGRGLPQAVPRRAAGRRRRRARARPPAGTRPPRRSARWPPRAGAWGVRVHDVGSTLDAVAVAAAWELGARRRACPRRGEQPPARSRPDRIELRGLTRARPARGVRARAARRAGLRRRPDGVAGPGRRGGLRPAGRHPRLRRAGPAGGRDRRRRAVRPDRVGGRADRRRRAHRPAGAARSRWCCTSRRPRSRCSSPTSRWCSSAPAPRRGSGR